jgi:predicted nuclease of predicted toxin-antitoxin system
MKKVKFIANVNIEKPLIDFLIKRGFDIKWVAEIDKQMSDNGVCEIANKEQRILITNDKDFGEIVFFQKNRDRPNKPELSRIKIRPQGLYTSQ